MMAKIKSASKSKSEEKAPPSPSVRLDQMSDEELMAVMAERQAKRQAAVTEAQSAVQSVLSEIQSVIGTEDADAEFDRLLPVYGKALKAFSKVVKANGGTYRFSSSPRRSSGPAGVAPRGAISDSILSSLADGPKTTKSLQESATVNGALSGTNNPSSRIAQTLALLRDRGLVESVERGVWRLVVKAEAAAA